MPIRPTPNSVQAKFDRLNTMAKRGPLSQTNQRNLAFYQKQLGTTPQDTVQAVSGAAPFTPQAGGPQLPGGTPQGGPISGPGAPLPAGPGPGLMGGGNPPVADYTGAGSSIGGSAAGTPAGMNMRTMKKGGKVKKMASGGMTSKVSSASSRADGIAQRGKTKCKIY